MAVNKKSNIIGPFIGQWYPINPYANSRFISRVGNSLYMFPTVQHAISACSCAEGNIERLLRYSQEDPRLAKSWCRNLALQHEDVRLVDFFNCLVDLYCDTTISLPGVGGSLYHSYANAYISGRSPRFTLAATGTEDIVYFNYWHDNYLGICACARCQARTMTGLNYYGAMLMAIRFMIETDSLIAYRDEHLKKDGSENVISMLSNAQPYSLFIGENNGI